MDLAAAAFCEPVSSPSFVFFPTASVQPVLEVRSLRRRIVKSNRLSEDVCLALVGKVETYLGVVSFERVEVGSG